MKLLAQNKAMLILATILLLLSFPIFWGGHAPIPFQVGDAHGLLLFASKSTRELCFTPEKVSNILSYTNNYISQTLK